MDSKVSKACCEYVCVVDSDSSLAKIEDGGGERRLI